MVKLWSRQEKDDKPERSKRIQNMSERDLRGWLNSSLLELGMVYDQWAYHNAPANEVSKMLNIVVELWEELQERPTSE